MQKTSARAGFGTGDGISTRAEPKFGVGVEPESRSTPPGPNFAVMRVMFLPPVLNGPRPQLLTLPPTGHRTVSDRSSKDARARARRAYRERARAGRMALVGVQVDDVAWPQILIELGLLSQGQEDDRRAVSSATNDFLAGVVIGRRADRRG